MLNSQEAWGTIGLGFWALHVPDLIALEKNNPSQATGRAYRQGFKEAVNVSNRYFCEMLKPEHRQN